MDVATGVKIVPWGEVERVLSARRGEIRATLPHVRSVGVGRGGCRRNLVERTCGVQEGLSRVLRDCRQFVEVALLQGVALRGGAEEEPALAPSLDERLQLAVPHAPRQLQVALHRRFAAVAHMVAAGRGLLYDERRKKRRVDFLHPRCKKLAVLVEVHALEVPGYSARNHTNGVVLVREPRPDLDFRRKPRLPVLPGADGGVLPRLGSGKAREAGGEIRHSGRGGYCSHVASFASFGLFVRHPLCERTLSMAFCQGS